MFWLLNFKVHVVVTANFEFVIIAKLLIIINILFIIIVIIITVIKWYNVYNVSDWLRCYDLFMFDHIYIVVDFFLLIFFMMLPYCHTFMVILKMRLN